MDRRLSREDWIRAGRKALFRGGPAEVSPAGIAEELGVTKGSFYWHFKDRSALLEALLSDWESEGRLLLEAASRRTPASEAVRFVFDYTYKATAQIEEGGAPSNAAIYAWAQQDAEVAARVAITERLIIDFLTEASGRPEEAMFLYFTWRGFVAVRASERDALKWFPSLQKIGLELLFGRRGKPRADDARRKERSACDRC